MDDMELHDVLGEINDLLKDVDSDADRTALLQAKAVVALGYQVSRFGTVIEDLLDALEPKSRRPGLRGWLS